MNRNQIVPLPVAGSSVGGVNVTVVRLFAGGVITGRGTVSRVVRTPVVVVSLVELVVDAAEVVVVGLNV